MFKEGTWGILVCEKNTNPGPLGMPYPLSPSKTEQKRRQQKHDPAPSVPLVVHPLQVSRAQNDLFCHFSAEKPFRVP